MNKYYSVLLLTALLFLTGSHVSAEVKIPEMPRDYVVDLAGVIPPDIERALNIYLLELEQKTTAQVVILTVKSLEGESLEDFSVHVAHDKWKLGQKGKDNGVLLLASIQDRDARIEVGYGLEGLLTDAHCKRIIEQRLKPYFDKGEYSNGIVAAAETLIGEIAADAGVQITGSAAQRGNRPQESTLLQKIGSVFLIIVAIYLFIRHPRLFLLLLMMSGGGRRGGWGGGGGFSGGGGTFGGGGGGGFGGGGASGSW